MKASFFQNNRRRLADTLKTGPVVLSSYRTMQRGNDASFLFEQEANFWYVTGIDFADWMVIIDGQQNKSWLVAPEVDKVHQIFDGSLSWDEAKKISGVDEVIQSSEAKELLKQLATKYKAVYTLGKDPHASFYDFVLNPAQANITTVLKRVFGEVSDCRPDLARLRAIKQPDEITAIKKAIQLTNLAFSEIKDMLATLQYEYQIEAEFSYRFKNAGATGHAYDPIVASGSNAVTLHYNANNQHLQKDSLVLIDIGARVEGYAADITRTYAVGASSSRQRAVHSALQSAQQHIIALLRPGLDVIEYQHSVDQIMQDALIQLGLMKSRADIKNYRLYFPHAVSHGLGIDVHDSLGGPKQFESGMILTVEPGIYIPEEGIGVRIEDDILITDTGHENLSGALSTSL